MHEVEVLALPKPGIHRPPCERLTSRSLTGSTAIHGVLQLPACVLIIEYLRAPLDHHRPEDVGHCVQVFQGIQRRSFILASKIASRAAAVLRWAGAVAASATRISLARFSRQVILNPDLVPPGDVQVVLIDKPGAFAQPQPSLRIPENSPMDSDFNSPTIPTFIRPGIPRFIRPGSGLCGC